MSWIDKRTITVTKKPSFSQLASWVFLVVSALLLIYVYYRAEIIFQGNNSASYSYYYILFIVAILFWGIVLRIKESIRVNIVITTISIIACLYIIELCIVFFESGNLIKFCKFQMCIFNVRDGNHNSFNYFPSTPQIV